ncbi:MAG: hypothetical protein U5P41_05700 [Gammaproteobacteria bacterium]|nr:hypothetical protein [Gammaproteobacteria bacterium]
MGAQSTLFGPLKYGILPEQLELAELTGGNGMIQMGTYISILLGTMLGGVLIAVSGYGPYLITIVVLLFAYSGWFASRHIARGTAANPVSSSIPISCAAPSCCSVTASATAYC